MTLSVRFFSKRRISAFFFMISQILFMFSFFWTHEVPFLPLTIRRTDWIKSFLDSPSLPCSARLLSSRHLPCRQPPPLQRGPLQDTAAPSGARPLQAAAPCEQPARNRRPLKAAGRRPLEVACRHRRSSAAGTYYPILFQIKHHGSTIHIAQWSQL